MQAIDIKYTREFLAGDTVGIGVRLHNCKEITKGSGLHHDIRWNGIFRGVTRERRPWLCQAWCVGDPGAGPALGSRRERSPPADLLSRPCPPYNGRQNLGGYTPATARRRQDEYQTGALVKRGQLML